MSAYAVGMDLPALYHHAIEQFLAVTALSDTLAHIHIGMAIYLISQLVLRERRASLHALTIVFAFEAINETMDRLFTGSWRWPDTLGDVAATMFWPTMCVLFSQYRRRRWAKMTAHRAFLSQVGLMPAPEREIDKTQPRGVVAARVLPGDFSRREAPPRSA